MSDDKQEPYTQRELDAAQRYHESHYQGSLYLANSVISFGAEAMKAAAFISGGSAAALLAFIGALVSKDQFILVSWLPWPLAAFVIGFIAACSASSLSYLAQFSYSLSREREEMTWRWPYSNETSSSRILNVAGWIFHSLAALAMLACYIALIVGYLAAYRAINEVGFHPAFTP